MKHKILKMLIGGTITTTLIVGCKKNPIPVNEEEVITTVIMSFTPNSGGIAKNFTWYDADGDGGITPIITTDSLDRNTNYSCVITVLNQLETPTDTISKEITTEGNDHQFFYTDTPTDLFSNFVIQDLDINTNPIGLRATTATKNVAVATAGTLNLVLKHEPNKVATNPETTGETDIDIVFPVKIK